MPSKGRNMPHDIKVNINNKIYNANGRMGAIIGHFLGVNHCSKCFKYNLINIFESQFYYLWNDFNIYHVELFKKFISITIIWTHSSQFLEQSKHVINDS